MRLAERGECRRVSGKVVGMVFDHYPNGGSELLLAVKLADNAADDGRHIFPSVATLAAQTRQSERTVQYQLKRMVAIGWLVLVREAVGGGRGGGYGRPREYRIHPDWVRAHDAKLPEVERPVWAYKDPDAPAAGLPVDNPGGKEMGAKIAPNKPKKWVQPSAEMGATAVAEMGATAVAPYPSLTVIEQIQTPPNPPPGGASDFEQFIGVWPQSKRTKVVKARAEFARAVAQGVTAAKLIAAAVMQADVQKWADEGARRVPAPDRWLREWRWLDGMAMGPDAVQAGWLDSRVGVEAMGERLGVGRWDKAAFDAGRGVAWPSYRARVIAAANAAKQGGDARRAA